jgi:hypothetical protein
MKERPILFSGPMVRAILEGRKTQTRRVVKPQSAILTDEMARVLGVQPPAQQNAPVISCPYGVPGDRLWVRETYAWSGDSSIPEADRIASGEVWYRADGGRGGGIRWRPSIFMPRWASRILLEITDVRVERLQDISDDDCRAEGYDRSHAFPREWFARLWASINGTGSWAANPLVWVVSFQRVTP